MRLPIAHPEQAGHDGGDAETDKGPQEQLVKVLQSFHGGAEFGSCGKGLFALGYLRRL